MVLKAFVCWFVDILCLILFWFWVLWCLSFKCFTYKSVATLVQSFKHLHPSTLGRQTSLPFTDIFLWLKSDDIISAILRSLRSYCLFSKWVHFIYWNNFNEINDNEVKDYLCHEHRITYFLFQKSPFSKVRL